MWIRQLILTNFQKHSNLTLDFTSGLNVLYGATDMGKSCIRRAIAWVFYNKTCQGLRKENTKKTSVKGVLNNGVSIERIKSASLNTYILTVGDDKKRFDSVGREIPEEIQKALRTSLIDISGETINLNIADQIALPFLMDKSGTFRSKLFNKLTGSEITDKVLQDLNKDILKISREDKLVKEDLVQKEVQQIDMAKNKTNLEHKYNIGKEKYEKIEKQNFLYSKLNELSNKLISNEAVQGILIEKSSKFQKEIPSIIDLRKKEDKLGQLITLKNCSIENENNSNLVKNKIKTFKEISTSSLEKLKNIWSKIDMFKNLNNKISVRKKQAKEIKIKQEEVNNKLGKWINRYKEELQRREICPTCKQKITEETVKGIKL